MTDQEQCKEGRARRRLVEEELTTRGGHGGAGGPISGMRGDSTEGLANSGAGPSRHPSTAAPWILRSTSREDVTGPLIF
jgi:hypothetical protein